MTAQIIRFRPLDIEELAGRMQMSEITASVAIHGLSSAGLVRWDLGGWMVVDGPGVA